VGGANLFVLHNIGELWLDPNAEGYAAVIFGHSHRPLVEHRNGVLYLNPGSAGPRRLNLPVSVARLRIRGTDLLAEIIPLDDERPTSLADTDSLLPFREKGRG
jgi:predicted phosphodiesterase